VDAGATVTGLAVILTILPELEEPLGVAVDQLLVEDEAVEAEEEEEPGDDEFATAADDDEPAEDVGDVGITKDVCAAPTPGR
jgi:hypothetical protein